MLVAIQALATAMLMTVLPTTTWSTDTVNDQWADEALAQPEQDDGWTQPCHDDWNDNLESACEVRELPYTASGHAIGIDGGENGGMTVIGWDKKEVRVLYRVKARAA